MAAVTADGMAQRPGRNPALRALGWFWGVVLLALAGGTGALQYLGPVPPPPAALTATPARPAEPAPALLAATTPARLQAATPTAGLDAAQAAGLIAAPDPALLEPSTAFEGGFLPRLGPGGRASLHVYAALFDATAAAGRPRVAILLSGIGTSQTASEDAIRATPGAISLAMSPYAFRPGPLLAAARAAGHEVLLSLPLEPDRYPIDDPGNKALLTGNPPAVNAQRLEWALTRFAGYAGVTGALGALRGERYGGDAALMDGLLRELAARGLLYIDPRPGSPAPPLATGRSVDVVIDEPAPVRAEIEANLARLEQVARDRGAALGLVSLPRPVTLDRIAAWASTLEQRGFVLAPVSAIVSAPPLGKAK